MEYQLLVRFCRALLHCHMEKQRLRDWRSLKPTLVGQLNIIATTVVAEILMIGSGGGGIRCRRFHSMRSLWILLNIAA